MSKSQPYFRLAVAMSMLAAAQAAPAAEDWIATATKHEYCEQWQRNAFLGAQQNLRGAARQIVPVSLQVVAELIEHDMDGSKLFILDDDNTPAEREFIERSTLSGFDQMSEWRRDNPNQKPDPQQWQAQLYDQCMSSAHLVRR